MAPSESATTASDPASMASYERARTSASVSPLQRHQKRMRSILYTSAANTPRRRWTYYTTAAIREQMAWRGGEQQSMWACYAVNPAPLLRSRLPAVNAANILPLDPLPQNLQPIRTRRLMRTRKAQIRGVWGSIRPRNQYRSAASAFALSWEIGRFAILICRYLSHQFNMKVLNKVLISIALAYIFCLRTPSSVFVFTSLRLPHLLWNFQLQSWSITHLRFSQWISSQCRSIEEMNSRFETKLEKEKKIVLRACLRISIEILSYQREFTSN